MRYRLGLNVGMGHIGWAVIEVGADGQPIAVRDMGVRKYQNGREDKSQAPLAERRRLKRQARRLRLRFVRRRTKLLNALTRLGLMPADDAERRLVADCTHPSFAKLGSHPYALRAAALDIALPPYALGRTLFALNQRRGFKSGRLGVDEKEDKAVTEGTIILEARMIEGGFRTVGQYFADILKKGGVARDRRTADDTVERTGLQTTRKMLTDEFEAIRAMQAKTASIKDDDWEHLQAIIFHQRPLKPVDLGKCGFYGPQGLDVTRAYAADPLAQGARAWQDINHLKIILDGDWTTARHLTDKERRTAWALLASRKSIGFKTLIKKLALPENAGFNLESAKGGADGKLLGMGTDITLSAEDMFGDTWMGFATEEKTRIVTLLQREPDADVVTDTLMRDFGLDESRALSVAAAKLEPGSSKFSPKALVELEGILATKLVDKAANRYASITEALDTMGAMPRRPEGISERLGYYARMMPELGITHRLRKTEEERLCGVIANPSVHIGLNQLRAVMNAILASYGHPVAVGIELDRELKLNRLEKLEVMKTIKRQKDLRAEMLAECANLPGVNLDSPEDWMKYRLWRELGAPADRLCVYSGRSITLANLFSPDVQMSHILPRSRSLDDGMANLVLAFRNAAKMKGDQTPWEHYNDKPEYDAILERVARLPANKRWRFTFNALERLKDEEKWLSGLINDRRYLSKMVGRYVAHICPDITVSAGRLSGKARRQWFEPGLASGDYRRRAVDALVTGLLSHAVIREAHNLASRGAHQRSSAYEPLELKCPIDTSVLARQVKTLLDRTTVSHRVDHDPRGALHEETARPHTHPSVEDPAKRTRLVAIQHRQGKTLHTNYYEHGGIHRLDIWCVQEKSGRSTAQKAVCVPVYAHEANRAVGKRKATRPAREATLVVQLHKGDCIRLDRGDGPELGIVRKISPSNMNFAYTPVNEEARPTKDSLKGTVSNYRYVSWTRVLAIDLRKVHVDALGRVKMGGKRIAQ